MKLALLSGLFAAACALASPVDVKRNTHLTVKRDNNGLEWISQDDTLPKVLYVPMNDPSPPPGIFLVLKLTRCIVSS